jgi:nitrate/nitrite transporter NarK
MVRALVAFRTAFSVGKMSIIIFLPIYARTEFGVGAFAIGVIHGGGKLAKASLQGWMGDLTDRVGQKHWFVLVGALLYAVGIAMVPLAPVARQHLPSVTVAGFGYAYTIAPAIATLFCAYLVLGVADSIRLPASMALFVSEGERIDSPASSMSLRSISWKVGQVTGPLSVGAIKDFFGATTAFLTASAFIVLSAGVFLVVRARANPPNPQPAPSG